MISLQTQQTAEVRKIHGVGKKSKHDTNPMSHIVPIQNNANFNPSLARKTGGKINSNNSMPSPMQRSSVNRSPISGQLSPSQNPISNIQSGHMTGHVGNTSRMSPQSVSQTLSPDNSLSLSSNSRTGIHSGLKPKPAKRVQSQSPAKVQNEMKVKSTIRLLFEFSAERLPLNENSVKAI